mgnify:CR=1 FL=1
MLVSNICQGAASLMISIAKLFLDFSLSVNHPQFIIESSIVQTGFSLTLAVANFLVVVGLLVIGVGTILGNSQYGSPKKLVTLLTSAVVVNFGLVIGAFLINISDMFMMYFLNSITGAKSLGDILASSLEINKLNIINDNPAARDALSASTKTSIVFQSVLGALMPAILGFILAMAIIAIAATLFVRFFNLTMLLVVMPLSYFSWLKPKGIKMGFLDNWWGDFQKWLFYGPFASMFLYLAVLLKANSDKALSDITSNSIGGSEAAIKQISPLMNEGFMPVMMKNVLVVGVMLFGLQYASSMSSAVAKYTNGLVKDTGSKLKGGATKWGKRRYQMAKNRALNTVASSETYKGAADRLGRGSNNKVLKYTGISAIGSAIGRSMQKGQGAPAKQVLKTGEDKWEGLGADQIANNLQGSNNAPEVLAGLAKLAKDGKLNKVQNIGGVSLVEYLKKNEQVFKDYGQAELIGKIRKQRNLGLLDAHQNYSQFISGKRVNDQGVEVNAYYKSGQLLDQKDWEKERQAAAIALRSQILEIDKDGAAAFSDMLKNKDKLAQQNYFGVSDEELKNMVNRGELSVPSKHKDNVAELRKYYHQQKIHSLGSMLTGLDVGGNIVGMRSNIVSQVISQAAKDNTLGALTESTKKITLNKEKDSYEIKDAYDSMSEMSSDFRSVLLNKKGVAQHLVSLGDISKSAQEEYDALQKNAPKEDTRGGKKRSKRQAGFGS